MRSITVPDGLKIVGTPIGPAHLAVGLAAGLFYVKMKNGAVRVGGAPPATTRPTEMVTHKNEWKGHLSNAFLVVGDYLPDEYTVGACRWVSLMHGRPLTEETATQ